VNKTGVSIKYDNEISGGARETFLRFLPAITPGMNLRSLGGRDPQIRV
jgi:hypothetical protein